MMGPNVRAARELILVCLTISIVFSTYLCAPAIAIGGLLGVGRDVALLLIGATFGAGVTTYAFAKQDDELLRREVQQSARELVDKTTFGGFRRHH
jgi:hypothetical protein